MEFEDESLSRHEGHFLSEEEAGTASMEVVLQKGDVIYLPRGTIYNSESSDTISMILIFGFSELNSWVDLIEETFTKALTKAVVENIELRKSLPYDYGNNLGFMHSSKTDQTRRNELLEKASDIFKIIYEKYLPKGIDDGADEMMCKFLKSRKNPQNILSDKESGQEDVQNEFECNEKTKIKLISKYSIRLVKDEEDVLLFYSKEINPDDENNLDLTDDENISKIDITKSYQDAFVYLFNAYPKYVMVKDLPMESIEEKIEFATSFIDKEVLLVE